jgi:uncharacterized protein (TIGR02996 family)
MMEAALLQAIHASPSDELAWQALADWLEEQADPRAELARLSLLLRHEPAGAAGGGTRREWEERLQTLLASGLRPCVPLLSNSIGLTLALIPAGTFVMGSPADEAERRPDEEQHDVALTQPFYLGVFPVTQEQYQKVMGSNPSHFSATGGGKHRVRGLDTSHFPADSASWEEAVTFCTKLSALPAEKRAGRAYRLPSEAEWEYACRAGSSTPFHCGSSLSSTGANCNGNWPYGGAEKGPYLGRTTAVGSYTPNAWGLFDMHGNIGEWTADRYEEDYYQRSPWKDPPGPERGSARVLRGGAWLSPGHLCRAADRLRYEPDHQGRNAGFRVACSLPLTTP